MGLRVKSYSAQISKIYLNRIDVDPNASGPPKVVQVVQLVMPNDSFIAMTAFFEHRLKVMVNAKAITQEAIDKARQFWIDNPQGE